MNKAQMITYIQEIIHFLRIQNYHEGCMRFRVLLQEMQQEPDVREALLTQGSSMMSVMTQMLAALENDDVILLADLLEEALLPLIKELIVPLEPIECGKYNVEITSSGYWTVKHIPDNLYLHSNSNPMEEARVLVDRCFDSDKETYAVWGCGLGYHIVRLYEAARGAISITVFDEDAEIIELAMESGIMEHIPEERITYIADHTGEEFVQFVAEHDAGVLLHYPSVKTIQNKALRDAMQEFFAGWNSVVQFHEELAVNFRSNIERCQSNVDELEAVFREKEVVLVAAGPSLDNSLEFLRKVSGKKVIVAVSTVLKKLLAMEIVPDYAVVMDSQKRTLGHIEGIENATVPLIVDSTACWEFADKYAGEKYIAYQKGYRPAEECALQQNRRMYETGGSVITLILDVVLQLGAKKVYFVGVDLAYPQGKSHASDTMDQKVRDISGMEPVKAVNGDTVYADSLFIGYRKWVERKIKEYPEVMFYNCSDCGAEIEGTQIPDKCVAKEISVVVPCYNVEKYIDECVSSLVNQTFGVERMEIILVDDGSTDSTFEKLCVWEQQYPDSILVIRLLENSKQGTARNIGMQYATGRYLGFTDSDDYVSPEMFQTLYDYHQREDVDCVVCARYDEYEDGRRTIVGPLEDELLDLSNQRYPGVVIHTKAPAGVVQHLYKKEWIKNLDIWFPERLTYEDNFFDGIINYYMKKVWLIKTPLYHYRINNVSTVQKKNSLHHLDRLKIELMKLEELIDRGLFEIYRENIEFEFLQLYFANSIIMLLNRFDELPEGVLLEMQQTVKNLFPGWMENPLLRMHKDVYEMCQLIDYSFVKGDKRELLLAYDDVTDRGEETSYVQEDAVMATEEKRKVSEALENIEEAIYYMSILYEKTNDINILYTMLECAKDERIDCLTMENLRHQIEAELFIRTDAVPFYEEEREFHDILLRKWEKEYGSVVDTIPMEERKRGVILVTTNQFLGLRHAPTKLVVEIIKCLKSMGFQVYLLVNYTCFTKEQLMKVLHWGHMPNVFTNMNGRGIWKCDTLEIPYLQLNYTQNTKQAITVVNDYAQEIKPEFVWHIGGTSFISDMIGRCSTMIATKCTDGYAVSEAPVLASFSAGNSSYVEKSKKVIEGLGQKICQFMCNLSLPDATEGIVYKRSDLNLPEDKCLLCMVGNRLDLEVDNKFLEWISGVMEYSKDIRFVTIGKEVSLDAYPCLRNKIIQLGYQENLKATLACMDIYVNPPRQGGGASAVCAMAAGIPAITLGNCDVANAVPEVFIVSDLTEMYELVMRCVENKTFYEAMCRDAVEKNDELLRAYEERGMESIANIFHIARTYEVK